ncbi:hypothetical protein M23134_07812 [Microscilla marina ATCC 23134]|uniref:Uncharacterized protein n=1 Tax=Microscilla marina ATCC 23134 TaxID=313606 RepID=A1ZLG0_MICM2|nr:hypothetical protein M23134_07812 [Microscilla marina ATCC 23134]
MSDVQAFFSENSGKNSEGYEKLDQLVIGKIPTNPLLFPN